MPSSAHDSNSRVTPIPLSALQGDNVIKRSSNTPWYQGPTLLGFLETVDLTKEQSDALRFPVQWVNRPNANFEASQERLLLGGGQRPSDSSATLRREANIEHCPL